MEVNVRVAEAPPGNGVPANPDARNRADGVEDFKEEPFVHVGGKVADVEGGGVEGSGGCGYWGGEG